MTYVSTDTDFQLTIIYSCGENANCDETIFDIVDVLAQTIPIV